jgi:hypothetical protein
MEKIINYKFKDFIKINDDNLISNYLMILEHLNPPKSILNPMYRLWNKEPYRVEIKSLFNISFSQVQEIKDNINDATIDSIISSIEIVTGIKKKNILNFKITLLYSIINGIKEQLEQIISMEINELSDEEDDIDIISTNANERMAKFGVINTIDSLANGDLTKWNEIENTPYIVVFTKLKMDREKNKIQKEISELQRKRIK